MHASLPRRDVVLLGVGHTNAHVLRMWRMKPLLDTRLTCISDFPAVTYSGMLPGVLSGQYPPQRMEIDLVRLCAAAGARLIVGDVQGLDVPARRLLFKDRPPLPFDVLSIGIGSVPSREDVEIDAGLVLPIKPMQTFLARVEERLRDFQASRPGRPIRIVIVGGGAGGAEIALCLPRRIEKLLPAGEHSLTLIHAGERLVEGTADKTGELVRRILQERGAKIVLGKRVTRVGGGRVETSSGGSIPADLVLWATGASPPPLLANLGLPLDRRGFLLTDATLRSVSGEPVFAVGDTGTIQSEKLPKAGVYAVRSAGVLWENIARLLDGRPLTRYRPQRRFLKLLNSGDGRAIADYAGFTFHGKWCWRLKDWIDGRFMDKYQDYEPMEMRSEREVKQPEEMRCAGCGGKVGGSVLRRVLARLEIPPHEKVVLGLDRPDDAAVLSFSPGASVTVTADFFAAPLEDPYTVGRLAALNAASDLFAKGAKPAAAIALATLPAGNPAPQEQMLLELLSGGLAELRKMGATLVGGHTTEGPQLTIGYTLLAEQNGPPLVKGALRGGDALVLTKPLGTGVLLRAHMLARCRAEWFTLLLESMLQSNQPAAELAAEFDVSAVTDVTGFGLAGHLLEMLSASGVSAELALDNIPLLPGAAELLAEGLESTLASANRDAEASIELSADSAAIRRQPAYAALFDPQTSGGLLIGVSANEASSLVEQLRGRCIAAAIVARARTTGAEPPRIVVGSGPGAAG